MRRILIHAGFHKTGTSSVQKTLENNRVLLDPVCQIYLHAQLTASCNAARTYSVKRHPAALVKFATGVSAFAKSLPADDTRDVIISAEDLCGLMPGRRGVLTYEAAPLLMKALILSLEDALPALPELIFYFSLREPSSWLNSCYAHHVRVVQMTQSRAEYTADHQESAELSKAVDRIRVGVAPHRVEASWLHDVSKRPLGPLDPIADLLQWPAELRDQIKIAPPTNVGLPKELLSEFLDLNRGPLEGKALRQAKAEARKRWQREQTKTSTPDGATSR